MYGQGLLTGLKTTFKAFFSKKLTEQYPEFRPVLPPRSRGRFDLIEDKCIACGLCASACPNHVIALESVRDEETKKKKLTAYTMAMEQCLYCGFCVEACPTDALQSNQSFEHAVYFRRDINEDMLKKR
ncbi:MAG: NADH-quinone oxidoreductase subunit [Paenibacillaceae bacterium]|jgi:NADH-quinone oxidoreductase subunit I|nr:NADH-quinone oxidoreductase subunit [Paenibacillaceae bacterium]